MVEWSIRRAEASDQRTIRQLVNAERLDPTSLNWRNFLIAESSGQVVAIGQVRRHPGCEELGSLVVLPDYRHQGIAAALIHALEARAGRPLYLFCRARMEDFYEQFGYRRISFAQAPWFLKIKMLPALALGLIGIPVILMRKDQ